MTRRIKKKKSVSLHSCALWMLVFQFFVTPKVRCDNGNSRVAWTSSVYIRLGKGGGQKSDRLYMDSNFELVFVSRNPPDSSKEICYGDLVTEILLRRSCYGDLVTEIL